MKWSSTKTTVKTTVTTVSLGVTTLRLVHDLHVSSYPGCSFFVGGVGYFDKWSRYEARFTCYDSLA